MENHAIKFPEGHFVGIGSAFGIPLGLVLSIALDNFAMIGVGIALGIGIGVAIEDKYKREGRIRPLMESEKRQRKRFMLIGSLVFILGILAFFLTLL